MTPGPFYSPRGSIACAVLAILLGQANAADNLEARLARLPQPWKHPIHRLTFEEYDATLKYWAKQYPQLVTLQKRGEAHNGMPIYLLKIADSTVPDADKQVVMVYPEYEGRATYVCAVTPRGIETFDADLNKFVSNLRNVPNVDADAVARYIAKGVEIRLSGDADRAVQARPIQHGIGFRLRVPYRSPKLLDVSVNGHSLTENATDGYQAWYADGYTQLQINVPPAKTKNADLFVVTCAYDGNERRSYGFEPPAAVRQQLQGGKTN